MAETALSVNAHLIELLSEFMKNDDKIPKILVIRHQQIGLFL